MDLVMVVRQKFVKQERYGLQRRPSGRKGGNGQTFRWRNTTIAQYSVSSQVELNLENAEYTTGQGKKPAYIAPQVWGIHAQLPETKVDARVKAEK